MNLIFLIYKDKAEIKEFEEFVSGVLVDKLQSLYPYIIVQRCNILNDQKAVTVAHMDDAPPPPEYSCILEVHIEDSSTSSFKEDIHDEEKNSQLAQCCDGIVDIRKTCRIAVEQYTTDPEDIGPDSMIPDDGRMIKQIVNLTKLEGLDFQQFVEHYENVHAPMTVNTVPGASRYTRYFVTQDAELQRAINIEDLTLPNFDVSTHLWFRDASARELFAKAFEDPEIGRIFSEDSAKLFEPGTMQMFLVKEQVLQSSE